MADARPAVGGDSGGAGAHLPRQLCASTLGFVAAAAVLPAAGASAGWALGEVGVGAAVGGLLALGCALWAAVWGTAGAARRLGADPGPIQATQRVARLLGPFVQAAGIAPPRLWVLPSSAPNAFAVQDARGAVVGVTWGLLERLDDDELAAVLGHEVAHIAHGDPLWLGWYLAAVATLTALTSVAVAVGLATAVHGARRRRRGDGLALLLLGLVLFAASLLLGAVGVLVARVAALAALRQREFAADARSALWTGKPQALARALRRLEHAEPLAAGRVAAVFTVAAAPDGGWWARLFETHPPTAERIARLLGPPRRVGAGR